MGEMTLNTHKGTESEISNLHCDDDLALQYCVITAIATGVQTHNDEERRYQGPRFVLQSVSR